MSKMLLGNLYRLELAAEIASRPDEPVSALELSDATGVRYPRVQEELKRLQEAGLLSLIDDARGRTVEYKPSPSAFWKLCRELVAEMSGAEQSTIVNDSPARPSPRKRVRSAGVTIL